MYLFNLKIDKISLFANQHTNDICIDIIIFIIKALFQYLQRTIKE